MHANKQPVKIFCNSFSNSTPWCYTSVVLVICVSQFNCAQEIPYILNNLQVIQSFLKE